MLGDLFILSVNMFFIVEFGFSLVLTNIWLVIFALRRTPEEFNAGHVVGAVNVPFMLRVGPGMPLQYVTLNYVNLFQFLKISCNSVKFKVQYIHIW